MMQTEGPFRALWLAAVAARVDPRDRARERDGSVDFRKPRMFALSPGSRPHRRILLGVSAAAHLLLAGALLRFHRAEPRPAAVEVAFAQQLPQFVPLRRVAPVALAAPLTKRPPAPPPPPRHPHPHPPRTAARAAKIRVAPPPAPAPKAQPPPERPIVLQGLTIQMTSQARGELSSSTGAAARSAAAPGVEGGRGKLVAIGEVSEPPAVLSRADLRRFYPRQAMERGFGGDVVLQLVIGTDGGLSRVEVLRDPGEGLGPAGARAIREYRFAPARIAGEAVATRITFTLHFVVD